MDDLLIEDIDDELIREIQERALRNGRTIDQEVIYLLGRSLAQEAQEAKMREVERRKETPGTGARFDTP